MNTPLRLPPPRVLRLVAWPAVTIAATLAFGAAAPRVFAASHAFSALRAFAAPRALALALADAGETKPPPPPIRHSAPPTSPDGTCAYTQLSSGVSQIIAGETNFHFLQPNIYWAAVAVRPRPTDDWAIGVYDTALVEACVDDSLMGSNRPLGFVDLVVGDFNHNSLKSYYAHAYPVAGVDPATVEWDDGPDLLPVNGYPTLRTTTSNDVVECFDVRLFAGVNYSFTIASTGQAIVGVYVFRNPAAAPYWATLDDAELEITSTPEGTVVNYTAPETDWYGVVVVNENGESGEYRLEANTCFAYANLSAGVPQSVDDSPSPLTFAQTDAAWAAIGARAANATQNWEISVWQNYAVGANKPCWTSFLGSSGMGFGKVDVVAVDYNFAPLGPAYVRAVPAGATNTPGSIAWDTGTDVLTVGDPPLTQATGPSHLVRMWDLELEAGHVYRFEISAQTTGAAPGGDAATGGDATPGGDAATGGDATPGGEATLRGEPTPDCRLLLFRNHNGEAPFAAGRQNADLETSTFAPYAAPDSGRYGLAVVNDNGAVGEYTIRVSEDDVVGAPVPGPGAFVTRLVGVHPNPFAFGGWVNIEFELAQPGQVGFQLLDVAGRVRTRFVPATFGAGPSAIQWALPGDQLKVRRPISGIYFLRMTVDGRPVGATRLAMLMGR